MTPGLQSPITDEITKSKCTEIVLEGNLLLTGKGRERAMKINVLYQIVCSFKNINCYLLERQSTQLSTMLILYSM